MTPWARYVAWLCGINVPFSCAFLAVFLFSLSLADKTRIGLMWAIIFLLSALMPWLIAKRFGLSFWPAAAGYFVALIVALLISGIVVIGFLSLGTCLDRSHGCP
jgi:hypothetical protein